jgi:hypothetical protein
MKVRLIQMIDGQMVKSEFESEGMVAAIELRGFRQRGFNNRAGQMREELRGWATFERLAGPMWDGDAIRYEDAASNAALST